MTISKKLFLMTAVALNLGSLLNAYNEYTFQSIFNFAVTLSKQENPQAKVISSWLSQEITQGINTDNIKNIERIELIINAPLTLEEKIEHLTQIKPTFIRKYAINPVCHVARAIGASIACNAIIVTLIAIPAIIVISANLGEKLSEKIARELFVTPRK